MPKPQLQYYADGTPSVLRKKVVYTDLRFYQRSEILYHITVAYCQRFLPKYGDRTVDQMVQAARSITSNIAEGSCDGQTSSETELKLLGIAQGSNQELLRDYHHQLRTRHLQEWKGANSRFEDLHRFCTNHCAVDDYQPYFDKWSDDEFINCAICLCHMVDKGLSTYIVQKDREFVEQGGIRERMTAARLGHRETQQDIISALRAENDRLRIENVRLYAENNRLRADKEPPQA